MRFSQKTRSVLVTTAALFLTPFVGSSVAVALPVIAWELSVDAISLRGVATAFLLSASVFLIPFGELTDLYGRHRIFMAGIGAFTVACALSDRVEQRSVASWGMAITVLGLLGLSRADSETPLSQIVACLVTLGGGYFLFSSANANAVMGSVQKSYYGLASAALGIMCVLGHMLSVAVLPFVLAMVMGRGAIAPETMPMFLESVRVSLLAFAVLGVLGTVASMVKGGSGSTA